MKYRVLQISTYDGPHAYPIPLKHWLDVSDEILVLPTGELMRYSFGDTKYVFMLEQDSQYFKVEVYEE